MKRVISLLVLIAMLMTTLVMAVPAFADEGGADEGSSIATGANEETAGNKMTPTKTVPEGGVGVASWGELKAALAAGSKQIYLTDNITADATYTANITGQGDNASQLIDVTIDGNGWTITATAPLFNKTNNTTFKNLTIRSDIAVEKGSTPLAENPCIGHTNLENVTAYTTVTVSSNTMGNQRFSGLVGYAEHSTIKNVVVESTLKFQGDSVKQVNSSGIIVASAAGNTTIDNCVSRGKIVISAPNAFTGELMLNGSTRAQGIGGIAGQEMYAAVIKNCTNYASIEVTAPVAERNKSIGGILGYSDGTTIENCVNNGEITVTSQDANVAGIVAHSVGSTVQNSLNTGVITAPNTDKKAPIAIDGSVVNCYYFDSSFAGEAKGTALDAEGMLDLTFDNRKELKNALNKVAFLLDIQDSEKEANYINYEALEAVIAEAKEIIADFDITPALQDDINRVYKELLAAKAEMKLTPATKAAVGQAIKNAEAFKEENADEIYTTETWNRFAIALAVLKDIDSRHSDPGNAVAALDELDAAIEGLKKDQDIVSATDFAALAGQDGEFHLVKDIEISAPVSNFSGTLYGHGHTITLNGTALFEGLNGAEIYDLDIKGFAGDAQSLMGKAVGNVTLKGITVDTTSLTSAVFFDSASSTAQITVEGALISSDAEIGALVGDVNCKLTAKGIYVDADAPAFAGAVKKGSTVKNAYIDSKMFADKNGAVTSSASVLASGKVAFEMNAAFDGFAATTENRAFADINFVQTLGEDALPKLGEDAADRTNVVIAGANGYKNAGEKLVDTDFTSKPPVAPEKVDYTKLKAAIKKAEALAQTKYTPESFAAVAVRLAVAKSALDADTQAEVNSAQKGLLIAIEALEEKTVVAPVADELDHTKLTAAIAKAGELKADGYTKASWANLEAMLVFANIARRSNDQEEIDEAAANLEEAIAALEIFREDEEPEEETGESNTPAPEEEGGCGSVIGGAVVALSAVIALAGVSFKKKEN